jgi:hypothetical protein
METKSKGFDVEAELISMSNKEAFTGKFHRIQKRLGEKKLKLRYGLGILRRIIAEQHLLSKA